MLRAALDRLLQDLFTLDELIRFLSYYELDGQPIGELLVRELPAGTTPLANYTFELSGALQRRGLITEVLFRALHRERPLRKERITEVEALLGAGRPIPASPSRSLPETCTNPFYDRFVGRTAELHRCTTELKEGRSVLLVGGRRAGKTTLLRQLDDATLGRRLFHVDIAAHEPTSEADLLGWLGREFGAEGCHDRDTFVSAVRKQIPLVLAIDEADRLLGRPWVGPFLAWLRWLDDTLLRRDLSLLLAGGPMLSRYRDPDDRGSPVLNTTEPVYLEPLDIRARRMLLDVLGAAVNEEEMFRATGGHPFLLTKVLGRVWEGSELGSALREVFRTSQAHLETWRAQAGEDGRALLTSIPSGGLPEDDFELGGSRSNEIGLLLELKSLCLVDIVEGRVYRGPSLVLDGWVR